MSKKYDNVVRLISVWWYIKTFVTDFAKLLVFTKVFANICVRQEQMGMAAWKNMVFLQKL